MTAAPLTLLTIHASLLKTEILFSCFYWQAKGAYWTASPCRRQSIAVTQKISCSLPKVFFLAIISAAHHAANDIAFSLHLP